jgi:hypothetical protein
MHRGSVEGRKAGGDQILWWFQEVNEEMGQSKRVLFLNGGWWRMEILIQITGLASSQYFSSTLTSYSA